MEWNPRGAVRGVVAAIGGLSMGKKKILKCPGALLIF